MADHLGSHEALDAPPEVEAKQKKEEIHKEALERFKNIVAREEHSRHLSLGDRIFVDLEGGSYHEETGFLTGRDFTRENVGDGKEPPSPRYEIDLISPVIEQAVSDQREAEMSIKVRGVGQADKGLADVYNGLIKNIEITSDASDAYNGGFDEAQKGGYGGWEIVTEFSDNSFEQDIRIVPILSATESLFFGPAKKATKEDALYAFKLWDMDLEEFKVQFPKAIDQAQWETDLHNSHLWFPVRDKIIRVANYWRKRLVTKEIVQLEDGRVLGVEDLVEGMQIAVRNGEEKRRKVKTYKVERFTLNGIQVLKGPQSWAGKFIPLIPEFGVTSVINGQEIVRGRVRKGKDAQQIYNYTTSAIVEVTALAGKDITWMTANQMKGHIDDLSEMHVSGKPIQQYTHDPEEPGPPKKHPPPQVQQALIDQRQAAKEDVGLTVGAAVGTQDGTAADPRSGQAIREGNVNREKGNSICHDNHKRAVEYTGLQLADLISKLWTTSQQRRIIKPDGTEDFVPVNEVKIIDGKRTIINDLAQTTFDVIVDVGPTYASQRQEGADLLTKLAVENEAFAKHTPDLIAKSLDVPGSDELFERLRREGVMNGTIQPTDEEREEFQIDLREQIIQEVTPQIREQVSQEAQIKVIDQQTLTLAAQAANFNAAVGEKEAKVGEIAANTEKALAATEKMMKETLNLALDGMTKMLENFATQTAMGIPVSINEHDQRSQQSDLIDEEQQDNSPGPTSEQKTEFGLDSE